MSIFINSKKIIKCILLNNNERMFYYDMLPESDFIFLNTYLKQNNKIETLFMNSSIILTKKNFIISIVNDFDIDYDDINVLMKNKLYKPLINLIDLINIINTNDDEFYLEEKYKLAIEELSDHVTTLQKETINKFNVELTEYLSDNEDIISYSVDNFSTIKNI